MEATSEDAAYEQLRKLAMDRNIRIGDAARRIAAAELIWKVYRESSLTASARRPGPDAV